jgi:hypothetical protein
LWLDACVLLINGAHPKTPQAMLPPNRHERYKSRRMAANFAKLPEMVRRKDDKR